MTRKKLAKSARKFIRSEKARIRREVLDIKKQKEMIDELCQRYQEEKQEGKKEVETKVV